jgi:hypothetical protein
MSDARTVVDALMAADRKARRRVALRRNMGQLNIVLTGVLLWSVLATIALLGPRDMVMDHAPTHSAHQH